MFLFTVKTEGFRSFLNGKRKRITKMSDFGPRVRKLAVYGDFAINTAANGSLRRRIFRETFRRSRTVSEVHATVSGYCIPCCRLAWRRS